MGDELLHADLAAIRELAKRQRLSAARIRGIGAAPVLAQVSDALRSSDVAAICATAVEKITSALGDVAGRVDALAEVNRHAADAIGTTDGANAHRISGASEMVP